MNYYENKLKIGLCFGNWKVVSSPFKKDKTTFVTCECICGRIRDVRAWHLNKSMTNGCGCSNNRGHFTYKGIGDLSLSYFNTFKRHRISKGIYFSDEITIDYLWSLFRIQEAKCALSGLEIFLNPKWSNKGIKQSGIVTQTASLDRIDNSKGYEIGNVRWVHKDLNFMKGGLSDEDFIFLCREVYKRNINNCREVNKSKFNAKRLYFNGS